MTRSHRYKLLSGGVAVGTASAIAFISACAGDGNRRAPSSSPGQHTPTPANLRLPSHGGPCTDAIRMPDAAGDVRPHAPRHRKARQSDPPSFDLRSFELRASTKSVCARWTTAAPAPPGTTFTFGVYGPLYRHRLDA